MELLYFILGVIFAVFISPILDAFCSIILSWAESIKAKYGEIVNEANIRMSQAGTSDEPKQAIGFQLPDEVTYIEEEEDDE